MHSNAHYLHRGDDVDRVSLQIEGQFLRKSDIMVSGQMSHVCREMNGAVHKAPLCTATFSNRYERARIRVDM